MVIPKENHDKSYHKRFRVKYKRRRQCKTNYAKRIRLCSQYKNKYDTKKYRLVVRKTNKDIICQIISNDMTRDVVLASAYSHELKRYGLVGGLTNYPAAYCTGLLLARRVVALLKKDTEAVEEVTGEFHLEDEGDAFRAFLDTGLARCTTGANIFGALKGAVDGGLNIPHSTRRFAGNIKEENEEGKDEFEFDPEMHRERIIGEHIAKYMRHLMNEDEDRFKKQFRVFYDVFIN